MKGLDHLRYIDVGLWRKSPAGGGGNCDSNNDLTRLDVAVITEKLVCSLQNNNGEMQ